MFTFAVVYLQSVFEALVRGQVGSLPSAMCLWPRVGDSLMANVRPPLSVAIAWLNFNPIRLFSPVRSPISCQQGSG